MPVQPSEFEEKEYEGPLYRQLEESCGGRLWSPGQVFERQIGIDRALFLDDLATWQLLGSSHRRGVILDTLNLRFRWRRGRPRPLPNFKLNLFIQAKRSFFHSGRPRRLYGSRLRSPCWRFDIEAHQQEALEKVAGKTKKRAVVCYAAPAFHLYDHLFAYSEAETVGENSTFPMVAKLKNHTAWFYDRPGGTGVANPDREDIEGPDLPGLISDLQRGEEGDAYSLASLSQQIDAGILETSGTNPRRVAYFARREGLRSRFFNLRRPTFELMDEEEIAYFDVVNFTETFNLDWYVVG